MDIHEALNVVDATCTAIVGEAYVEGHYFHVHRVRFAYTLMSLAHLPQVGRFLEVGSDGLFLRFARDVLGATEVAGTHHTEDTPFIEFGDAPDHWMFYATDLENRPITRTDASFDTILCGEVIEHMPKDPMGLLAEINRLLVDGGRCLITTPNIISFRNIKMAIDGEIPMNFYKFRKDGSLDRHHIEYSPALLAETMQAAGFEVESVRTEDCWALPDPSLVDYMKTLGVDMNDRRDNIFLIARKVGPVKDRLPDCLYV